MVVLNATQDWVTLVELLGFLAKNQAPTGSSPLVKISALMTHEGMFDLDHSLCPVATKEIHADCITKWVCSVVSEAYASAKGMVLPEGEICAHDMLALASLCQAFSHSCSFAQMTATAFWCSTCTFTTFY